MPGVIVAFHNRYGFVRTPSTPEQMLPSDPTHPIMFGHGRLVVEGREILIERLLLYNHAIAVDTTTSTDDSELVIDDLLAAFSDIVERVEGPRPKMFISQLELKSDLILERVFTPWSALSRSLARAMASDFPNAPTDSYAPALWLNTLVMRSDPQKFVMPCDFRFERRDDRPREDMMYFSQAPLRTADHIAVLEEFERSVKEAGG